MVTGIILSLALLLIALAMRSAMDATIWHEANLFVTDDNILLDYEDNTAINLNTEKQIA